MGEALQVQAYRLWYLQRLAWRRLASHEGRCLQHAVGSMCHHSEVQSTGPTAAGDLSVAAPCRHPRSQQVNISPMPFQGQSLRAVTVRSTADTRTSAVSLQGALNP